MATATIISNTSGLQWQGVVDTNITESEDTTVTNSSGADVWYGAGSTDTRLKNGAKHTFITLAETVIYGFAQAKNTAAQITLTMTGNGPGLVKSPVASMSSRKTTTTEEVSSGTNVIDEVEVEVKIKIKLKDGKIVSVES